MMPQQPISIVGAGLAGLTLGRCLRQKGIPTVLFERTTSSPRFAYGITLHQWAYQPLLEMLEMDESAFRERLAVDGLYGGIGRIGPESQPNSLAKEACPPSSFRAHRGKLERLLRERLDIKWEHALTDVESSSEGTILCFQNGQRIRSTFVVSSDGPHSQFRKSLLPKTQFNILPFVVFNGKRRIRQDHFRTAYAPYLKDSNLIETRRHDTLLQISVNEHVGDIVDISYTYSRPARVNDPLHKPNRPIAGATDIPEEFYAELEAIKDLEQPFSDMFIARKIKGERVLHWLMRSVMVSLADLQELARQGVMMLGDAAHATPILGGEGANMAIKDGVDLAAHIEAKGIEEVATFYTARYDRWKKEVEASEMLLSRMHLEGRSVP